MRSKAGSPAQPLVESRSGLRWSSCVPSVIRCPFTPALRDSRSVDHQRRCEITFLTDVAVCASSQLCGFRGAGQLGTCQFHLFRENWRVDQETLRAGQIVMAKYGRNTDPRANDPAGLEVLTDCHRLQSRSRPYSNVQRDSLAIHLP